MADHGPVEYATAQGNDLPAHEATYDRFLHLVVVGSCSAINVLLGLAIGAVAGHWPVAFTVIIVGAMVGIHGAWSGARLPSTVMVVISLLALAFTSGG
jgi:hypothetical protein